MDCDWADGGEQACTAAKCGDGYPNLAAGEDCDDGNRINDDECSNQCTIIVPATGGAGGSAGAGGVGGAVSGSGGTGTGGA